MDNLNLKNLQLSYQAVYDETLCESMDELGLFGEYDYIDEGYKNLPVDKMIRQAARKPIKAALRQDEKGWPLTIAYEPHYKIKNALKQAEKMARVASRHSTIKGKGRIRGEGQALLNRLRGENRNTRNEEVEIYELLLSHLLDEGYSDSLEGAEAIIENMSDEWIEEIISEGMRAFPIQKVAQKAAGRYASKDPKKIALADKMTRPEVTQIPWVAYKGGPVGRFVDSGHRKVPSLRDYAKLIARSIKPER